MSLLWEVLSRLLSLKVATSLLEALLSPGKFYAKRAALERDGIGDSLSFLQATLALSSVIAFATAGFFSDETWFESSARLDSRTSAEILVLTGGGFPSSDAVKRELQYPGRSSISDGVRSKVGGVGTSEVATFLESQGRADLALKLERAASRSMADQVADAVMDGLVLPLLFVALAGWVHQRIQAEDRSLQRTLGTIYYSSGVCVTTSALIQASVAFLDDALQQSVVVVLLSDIGSVLTLSIWFAHPSIALRATYQISSTAVWIALYPIVLVCACTGAIAVAAVNAIIEFAYTWLTVC
jgi:hypothetical protein